MIWLMKREWKRSGKKLFLPLLIQMFILCIPAVLYLVAGEQMNVLLRRIYQLPVEIYSLFGIQNWNVIWWDVRWNLEQYLMFVMMFLNIWVAWSACMRMLKSVYIEEEYDTISSLCNQMYSRRQIAISKLLWGIASFLFGYLILTLELFVLLGIGNKKMAMQSDIAVFGIQQLHVILVVVMFLALTFLYAVCTDCIAQYTKHGFVVTIIFGTWMVGSLYKLRDVIYWIMSRMHVSIGALPQKLLWLNELRKYAPLSWINPYEQTDANVWLWCVGISVVSMVAAILVYEKRAL